MSVRLDLGPDPEPAGEATLEVVSPGDDAVRLIAGDNLAALDALAAARTVVQLAYLDPPFFTQREHLRTKRRRGRDGVERSTAPAFDDRWPDLASYLIALRQRLRRIRDLLSDDGCMVVHVDPTTSHYIKVMCDELFGSDAFASEIVWRYRRWPAKTPNFQRMHDVLLRYLKDPRTKPRFQQRYEPLAASTVATWGKTKQLAEFRDGRRKRSTRTSEPTPGTPLSDVWEISVIAPVAKERTGYPTQKPQALLTRVIETCSFAGDCVLDAYAGSGTTLVAAAALGRRAIGVDASEEAIAVARERLTAQAIAHRVERATRQP